MEKIHENMCKQVCSYVFIQENYIEAHVLMYFLHLVLTFTPHYIIMVKGLLNERNHITNLDWMELQLYAPSWPYHSLAPVSENPHTTVKCYLCHIGFLVGQKVPVPLHHPK